eukprot:scaffold10.g2489.t1
MHVVEERWTSEGVAIALLLLLLLATGRAAASDLEQLHKTHQLRVGSGDAQQHATAAAAAAQAAAQAAGGAGGTQQAAAAAAAGGAAAVIAAADKRAAAAAEAAADAAAEKHAAKELAAAALASLGEAAGGASGSSSSSSSSAHKSASAVAADEVEEAEAAGAEAGPAAREEAAPTPVPALAPSAGNGTQDGEGGATWRDVGEAVQAAQRRPPRPPRPPLPPPVDVANLTSSTLAREKAVEYDNSTEFTLTRAQSWNRTRVADAYELIKPRPGNDSTWIPLRFSSHECTGSRFEHRVCTYYNLVLYHDQLHYITQDETLELPDVQMTYVGMEPFKSFTNLTSKFDTGEPSRLRVTTPKQLQRLIKDHSDVFWDGLPKFRMNEALVFFIAYHNNFGHLLGELGPIAHIVLCTYMGKCTNAPEDRDVQILVFNYQAGGGGMGGWYNMLSMMPRAVREDMFPCLTKYPLLRINDGRLNHTAAVIGKTVAGIGPVCRGFPWCRPRYNRQGPPPSVVRHWKKRMHECLDLPPPGPGAACCGLHINPVALPALKVALMERIIASMHHFQQFSPEQQQTLFKEHKCPEEVEKLGPSWKDEKYQVCVIEWFMKRSNAYFDYDRLLRAVETALAHLRMYSYKHEVAFGVAALDVADGREDRDQLDLI